MAILVDRSYQFQKLTNFDSQKRPDLDEELVSLILESQSRRLDDQRTPLPADPQEEVFLNLLSQIQSSRMDDQRASLHLDSSYPVSGGAAPVDEEKKPLSEEEFIDLLFRCQSSRINDQRSPDPKTYWRNLMPGEDFFNLLQHLQSTRIEDQRSPFPSPSRQ